MKFLKREFDALQEVIIDQGFNPKEFHQVKKRGHLYVQQDGRADDFCFFRKKETVLNTELQWEDKITYFLDPKNQIQVDTWEEVLDAFKRWLASNK